MLPLGQALVPTRNSAAPAVAQMELMPVEVWLQHRQHGVPPWSKINQYSRYLHHSRPDLRASAQKSCQQSTLSVASEESTEQLAEKVVATLTAAENAAQNSTKSAAAASAAQESAQVKLAHRWLKRDEQSGSEEHDQQSGGGALSEHCWFVGWFGVV
jgi:hypothetical protein